MLALQHHLDGLKEVLVDEGAWEFLLVLLEVPEEVVEQFDSNNQC